MDAIEAILTRESLGTVLFESLSKVNDSLRTVPGES